jgi:DNA polymerase-1
VKPKKQPRPKDLQWNFNSPKQMALLLQEGLKLPLPTTKLGNPSTNARALSRISHPFVALLRDHRKAAQLCKNFGLSWLDFAEGGRLRCRWNQLGTATGRVAAKEPNLQQVPANKAYRSCFRAGPGRVLLKADYNQLQLRIAAKLSDDEMMLAAYSRGEDLHTETARRITGRAEVTKEERQLAKTLNFGLLFGMKAPGLRDYALEQYGVQLTLQQAADYRDQFFSAYPGLASWHGREHYLIYRLLMGFEKEENASRTFDGRRRFFDLKTPITERLASPVQGAEADGMKCAMGLLWERRGLCPDGRLVVMVHDELVVEAPEDQVEAAAGWLTQAMTDGMEPTLDPVPVVVEVSVGPSWGETKPLEEWLSTYKGKRKGE